MHFHGPERVDLDDLHEINQTFLNLLRSPVVGPTLLSDVPEALAARLRNLHDTERRRLARSPFLLCSCREDDVEFWQAMLQPGASADLFAGDTGTSPDFLRFLSGIIAFTWQLSRKNPFVARLVTGATTAWCEEIAAQPLLRLIDVASRNSDTLRLRLAGNDDFWKQLLRNGVSEDALVRRAARVSGLQRILLATRAPTRLLLAAKTTNAPHSRSIHRPADDTR